MADLPAQILPIVARRCSELYRRHTFINTRASVRACVHLGACRIGTFSATHVLQIYAQLGCYLRNKPIYNSVYTNHFELAPT